LLKKKSQKGGAGQRKPSGLNRIQQSSSLMDTVKKQPENGNIDRKIMDIQENLDLLSKKISSP
jgi:hypothetical protein